MFWGGEKWGSQKMVIKNNAGKARFLHECSKRGCLKSLWCVFLVVFFAWQRQNGRFCVFLDRKSSKTCHKSALSETRKVSWENCPPGGSDGPKKEWYFRVFFRFFFTSAIGIIFGLLKIKVVPKTGQKVVKIGISGPPPSSFFLGFWAKKLAPGARSLFWDFYFNFKLI